MRNRETQEASSAIKLSFKIADLVSRLQVERGLTTVFISAGQQVPSEEQVGILSYSAIHTQQSQS